MTDTTTSPLATTLREFANAFETGTRTSTGETFYKLKDDAPAWMRMDSDTQSLGVMHAIHCAVDGVESPRLPDDWIYEATVYLAYGLADRARYADDADELRDAVHEIADSQVDVSTSDLATWVAAHGWNAELVNEAIRERGNAGMGLHEQLAMGQYLALERIAYAILELCEEQANA